MKTIEEEGEKDKDVSRKLVDNGLRDSLRDAAVARVLSEMDASFALEERH